MTICWQVPYGSTAVFVVLRYHGSTVIPPNTTICCPVASVQALPALSLHALSTSALFTCRFHYPRNPYDVLYTLFLLPTQSIPPKWPLPAVSLHAY